MHDLWWLVLLVVCIAAAIAILFGIVMESLTPEPPEPPYRMEFDEFYCNDTDNRKE
jgi:hypothetical protein